MEVEGQVFSLTNNIGIDCACRFEQVGLPSLARAVERCAPSLQHNGSNTLRYRLEHDLPPAEGSKTW